MAATHKWTFPSYRHFDYAPSYMHPYHNYPPPPSSSLAPPPHFSYASSTSILHPYPYGEYGPTWHTPSSCTRHSRSGSPPVGSTESGSSKECFGGIEKNAPGGLVWMSVRAPPPRAQCLQHSESTRVEVIINRNVLPHTQKHGIRYKPRPQFSSDSFLSNTQV